LYSPAIPTTRHWAILIEISGTKPSDRHEFCACYHWTWVAAHRQLPDRTWL